MKADLTRSTFRKEKHYSGVRMQQGRVQLDADWNEQADIQAYLDRTRAVDVIGRSGAPKGAGSFGIAITPDTADLAIGSGRFYADGLMCELESAEHAVASFPSGTQATLAAWPADDAHLQPGRWVELVEVQGRLVVWAWEGFDNEQEALRWATTTN